MTELLHLDALSVGWPGQAPVLADISLMLHHGERVALVGPNGAGKSSLFLSIAGVLAPLGGQVRLMGRQMQTGQFLPDVALVFQQAEDQLFCPTLAEDVAFGARNMGLAGAALDLRVAQALAACHLTGLATRPVHQLSGGEKRRACIAGALVMQPALMLLDEPSAGLDLRNRRNLMTLLRQTGQALLIASHDLELVLELCPRVILIDQGRICADGPAREVLGDAGLMAAHGQEVPHSLTPHERAPHMHWPQAGSGS
ncbi:energy-coupling factor ABC transporter ATP-binding protein [Roseinatronobacter alkalisoli]|uniref:ABC transporter ATP-binding protein n=1 Tax=Roseinatronobacter alkalisoli TaxID=3028235 RepID=A0ABT5T7Q9_9RHOB|nr:ABC transporter ATP-binding protein [Roseinatronobacter sp. HJB301]MDD7971152.1 ABC transporter ATP-binding protein [Roseinatronobacter sp. HJB301]